MVSSWTLMAVVGWGDQPECSPLDTSDIGMGVPSDAQFRKDDDAPVDASINSLMLSSTLSAGHGSTTNFQACCFLEPLFLST